MEEKETTNKSNMPVVAGVIFLVALVAGGGYLFLNKGAALVQENTAQSTKAPENSAQPEGAVTAGEVKIVEVEAGSFYYKPNEIRVKKGEKVKITMASKDMMHDFNIDALGVKIPVTKSGSTGVVEFTADTAGEFEFYCSVGNHRQQGQIGKLIVE